MLRSVKEVGPLTVMIIQSAYGRRGNCVWVMTIIRLIKIFYDMMRLTFLIEFMFYPLDPLNILV